MTTKKVSNEYEDIKNENSLMIVSGTKSAKIFEVIKGKIVKKPRIEVTNPDYTDYKETFEQRRGTGTVWGTPSAYEKKDTGIKRDFLKQLKNQLKDIQNEQINFENIYLFAPNQVIDDVQNVIPAPWKKKMKLRYTGNFVNALPQELFERIKKKFDNAKNSKKLIKPEALKILKRPRKTTSKK